MDTASGDTPIALIGFMASGKTAVGRALALRLGWSFADTDDLVVAERGLPIAEIFGLSGEAAFRALEAAALERVTAMPRMVVAAGGGVVLLPENRRILAERCWTVFLRVSPATAVARASREPGTRPLLSGADPTRAAERLLAERAPLYETAADFVVDADRLSPESIVEAIVARRAR